MELKNLSIIRECPKDNQSLGSEIRRENSDYDIAISEHIRSLNKGVDRMNKIIGGCFMPSDVEYLVCPLCKWECKAYEYDEAIGNYWAMQRAFDRIKKK
jgi:hypothetical protein